MVRRILLGAALAAVGFGAADAATGSGYVSFNFTGFIGAFAQASPGVDLSNPANYQISGAVNGVTPIFDGETRDSGRGPLYLGGTAPLSGDTATFVYNNRPTAIANVVSFTPEPGFNNITTGEKFKLGTFSFTNGFWVGGSANPANNLPVNLSFSMIAHSATPEFNNQTFISSINVTTNQNSSGRCSTSSDQQDEADFLFINDAQGMGSLRVYDALCKPTNATNQGTIDFYGKFGSLDPVSLQHPGKSGFFVDSVDSGPLTSPPVFPSVPEPATWAMLILGLGGVGAAVRAQRKGGVALS